MQKLIKPSVCQLYLLMMKRSPLLSVSKRKAKALRAEQPIRAQLRARARGRCENCGKVADLFGLHPHEKVFRSQGGCLSMENSDMLCQQCHDEAQQHRIKKAKEEVLL